MLPLFHCCCFAGKTAKASTERSRSAKANSEQKPTQISSKAAQASSEPSDQVPTKRKAKTSKATTKGRKAKAASRVGLVNPTVDEMRTAFSLFNPQNKNVITTEDICRVGVRLLTVDVAVLSRFNMQCAV